MTERLEPTTWQIQASYKSSANTKLARALHPILSFGTYDRCSAHRWALKLIKADPQTGADVTKALANFEYMIPGAMAAYERNDRLARTRHDKVAEIFKAWKTDQERKAA